MVGVLRKVLYGILVGFYGLKFWGVQVLGSEQWQRTSHRPSVVEKPKRMPDSPHNFET